MAKQSLRVVTSSVVPLPIENVDTDQIIPARFLKATTRDGFGKHLFYNWRHDENGSPIVDNTFNNPQYSGRILVAGKNFGCGSSREHAAWALKDYGFDVVVSSFFADIFASNALNNFLLPLQVCEEFLQEIFAAVQQDVTAQVCVNLPQQYIELVASGEREYFSLSAYKKNCLIHGYDDIDYLLTMRQEIEAFEMS